jgi:hypothetical protein
LRIAIMKIGNTGWLGCVQMVPMFLYSKGLYWGTMRTMTAHLNDPICKAGDDWEHDPFWLIL